MKKVVYICMTVLMIFGLFIAVYAPAAETPATSQPSKPSADKPQYGGTLIRMQLGSSPSCMGDPSQIQGSDVIHCLPALETLIRNDEKGAPMPMLATSWSVAPDMKSVTFNLRKGVKFHDGTDFNAAAVKWNITKAKTKKTDFDTITSIDVVDDYTVRMNVSKFTNGFFNIWITAPLMVSPTAFEKNGADWAKLNPVGTGPFKFVSYQRDVSVKFTKNENYWDKGKPYLDGVEIKFIADMTVGAMAFEAGEAHTLTVSEPKMAADLRDKGFKLANPTYSAGFSNLGGDSINPESPFAKKAVREAIEYAIDKQAIMKMVGYGFYQTTYQPSPADRLAYDPSIKGRLYNPDKAKQLLTEAGYPNGFETKMTLTQQLQNKDVYTAVQSYLGKVGINVKIDQADYTRWSKMSWDGWKSQLFGVHIGPDPNYAVTLQRHLSVGGVKDQYPSVTRPKGWADLLSKALLITNIKQEQLYLQEMMRLATDDAMLCPIYYAPRNVALSPKLHDDNINVWYHLTWTPELAWLSK
jgi:ABC-type transport system substrate-binding protein